MKAHDWSVDQLADLFRTTTKVKTEQVVKNRGQYSGDIELTGYPSNVSDPVPLVLDLHIAHDRVGSSTDPTLNGHLRHPNNLDQSLNDTTTDKIRKYHTDYNNNPPSVVSFMTVISSTSGRLHSYSDDSHLPKDSFVLVGRSLSLGVPPLDSPRYHVMCPGLHGEEYQ